MSVLEQLANRDHLMVWSSDGIIVIEPHSLKNRRIHMGIQKELNYLRRVNSTMEKPKRLCAILSKDSITNILKDGIYTRVRSGNGGF